MKIKTILGLAMACLLLPALPAAAADSAAPEPPADSKPADQQPLDEQQTKEWLARQEQLFALYFPDETVETATRIPTPISRTVEDVTIITAEQIAELNAHTVGEVLAYVPGFLSQSRHNDFGDETAFFGHGLSQNHVLVLVDGVRFNNTNSGQALTSGIPLQIIKRIEVIKGPASSVWGSSLAGVVNIITKDAGRGSRPAGTASASYGEGKSQDYNFDVAPNHLYLYAGRQESDGLRANRFLDSNRFYGKLELPLPYNRNLTFSLGHLEPRYSTGDFPDMDFREIHTDRSTFGSLNFDTPLAEKTNLHLAAQLFKNTFNWDREALGENLYYGPDAGVPLFERVWDEQTVTCEGRLAIQRGSHTVVAGGEITRGEMEHKESYLPTLISALWWSPPQPAYLAKAVEENWGLYVNDTIRVGNLAIVPGLRFDHHSIAGNIVSPSLGATRQLGHNTIARLHWGRGFAYPPLSLLAGRAWSDGELVGNPDLKPERVWVVQGGIETSAVPHLHIATNIFHYQGRDFWNWQQSAETGWWFLDNQYDGQRDGFSLEAGTDSFHNFSLETGLTYVFKNNKATIADPNSFYNPALLENDDIYSAIVALSYNDKHFVRAKLLGRYAWWDEASSGAQYEYGNFLWDFVCGFKVLTTKQMTMELFGTVHNLFNTDQYWDLDYKNPKRWVEAGMRISY